MNGRQGTHMAFFVMIVSFADEAAKLMSANTTAYFLVTIVHFTDEHWLLKWLHIIIILLFGD